MSKNLYQQTYVPLPSQPLIILESDTAEKAYKKIDLYFNDLIQGYPHETQEILRSIYNNDQDIILIDGIMNNLQANWNLSANDKGIKYTMLLDKQLYKSPLLTRWNKIHEIAGHIGQVSHRISVARLDQWLDEVNSNAFAKFTEMSIAPAEKMLVDALPEKLIETELSYLDHNIRGIMKHEISRRRTSDYTRYTHLEHRKATCEFSRSITEDDYNLLHSRPDIQKFDTLMNSQTARLSPPKKQKHPPSRKPLATLKR